jgi:hypothetical protein
VEDGIDDNLVGEVNTVKNWGNTIIIKHADGLYSKLSHLQKGSVSVKTGDNVRYGQVIGKVGNSGRSPYPHLHFQLQSTPYIGSKTLKYPLFSYLENGEKIRTYSYPSLDQKIKHIEDNPVLKRALNFMPGTKIQWKIKTPEGEVDTTWEVFTNQYNKSFIFCNNTKSMAYFQNDGVYFSFTHFSGERESLLYDFYLTAFRVPVVYVDGYVTSDSLPANQTFKGWRLFLHDFTAPFFIYLKVNFIVTLTMLGSEYDPDSFIFSSKLTGSSFNKILWNKDFRLSVNKDNSLKLENKSLELEAICEPY